MKTENEYSGEHVIGETVYMVENGVCKKCVVVGLWNDGKNGFDYEPFRSEEKKSAYEE